MQRLLSLWVLSVLLLVGGDSAHAQRLDAGIVATQRAIMLSTQGGLSLAERTLPSNSRYVAYNPIDPTRWARIDAFGALWFVPQGGQEGLYTFEPYLPQYRAESAADNRLLLQSVQWSPDGRMLAFHIDNPQMMSTEQGVWFWQPLNEIPSDPSYQLLRNCPPACAEANADVGQAWRILDYDWSGDNDMLLLELLLPNESRRAITVRRAARDLNDTQANTAPDLLYYEYASWTNDSTRLVVSGRAADGSVGFGIVNPDGSNPQLTPANDIGMVWVQDAVQRGDTNTLVMLGSALTPQSPVQLVAEDGTVLTPPIGMQAPSAVNWSPDRTMVMLRVSGSTYIASVDGRVWDISERVIGAPSLNWVAGPLPGDAALLPVPTPLDFERIVPPTIDSTAQEPDETFAQGDILQVMVPALPVYDEPIADSAVLEALPLDAELIITGGPLADAVTTWWRVQTLNVSGWVQHRIAGQTTLRFAE